MRLNDLTFDSEFLTARREDGLELRFTRKERALLVQFIARSERLLTRSQLLDALSGEGSGASERNIDFIVNQLRTKLGDKAREPRFIATQYGEGYVWIAKPDDQAPLNAFLVVGPVYGASDQAGPVHNALSRLAEILEDITDARNRIAYAPVPRRASQAGDTIDYTLGVSLHRDKAILHAAFVLRHEATRQVIQTFRAHFAAEPEALAIENLAREVKQAIWRHVAIPGAMNIAPAATPLEVRIHDAALMLARSPESWRDSEARIEAARQASPDDPALGVMRGLALYARLLQHIGEGKGPSSREWAGIEDEIEGLALDCLPRVHDNPLLLLGVAKLLFFIDRGHFELAEQLTDDAFARSTAFAAAFIMLGQLRMCRGRFEEALSLYDKGIELSDPGSEFQVYGLILKCTALLADDDRAGLEATCKVLYAIKPELRMQLGLMLAPPGAASLAPDLEGLLGMIGETQAQRLSTYLYHVSARHFRAEAHRANVMRGLSVHLRRRFGKDILPQTA